MAKETIRIVKAQKEHLEPACQIAIAAWTPIRQIFREEIGQDLYKTFFSGWQAEKCRDVTRELSGSRAFVALVGARLAGFISYQLDEGGKTAVIGTNAVHLDFRGQGIGSRLYQHVLASLKAEGIVYVRVTTGLDAGHAPARRAYNRAGFSKGLPIIRYYMELARKKPDLSGQAQLVPAKEEHLDAAGLIAEAAWSGIHAEYEKLLGPELHTAFFDGWQDRKITTVRQELSTGRGFIALCEGQVAGFISYEIDRQKNIGYIGNNAVHSDFRGRGIGGQLYLQILASLKKEGAGYVTVVTGLDEGHAAARRAYGKAGFSKALTSISYYQKLPD